MVPFLDSLPAAAPVSAGHRPGTLPMWRAALVVNPRAGTIAALDGGLPALIREARAHFTLAGEPDPSLPIEIQARRALASDPQVLLVAGGDGTVGAVARLIGGSQVILGVIPGGTMNRVAARLGLPDDPCAAMRALAGGEPVRLPAAKLNGTLFLYQALIGPPSRLVRFREMQRDRRFGWLPMARAVIRALLRPLHRSVHVMLPGGARRQAIAVVVSVPEPDSPHGLLRVETIERSTLLARVRQFWLWLRGRLADAPDVAAIETAVLSVAGRTRRMRVSLDGEMMLLRPPLRIRTVQPGIRALRPRCSDG